MQWPGAPDFLATVTAQTPPASHPPFQPCCYCGSFIPSHSLPLSRCTMDGHTLFLSSQATDSHNLRMPVCPTASLCQTEPLYASVPQPSYVPHWSSQLRSSSLSAGWRRVAEGTSCVGACGQVTVGQDGGDGQDGPARGVGFLGCASVSTAA
jgi:hypothetical protein